MAQRFDIVEDKMRTIESASSLSVVVKESFLEWLSDGNAKRFPPNAYLACIDKVSAYLIRRKISMLNLWEITNFGLFKSVYDKAINDNLFKATDKNMHAAFIQVGKAFLKFLKSKPAIYKELVGGTELPHRSVFCLTIKDAIICVLKTEPYGMTAEQIYNKIIANGLYSFGAKNPIDVVQGEIDRACVNSNYTSRASQDCFRFERNQKGEKVYLLLSSSLSGDTVKSSITVCSVSVKLEQANNKPNNIEIWNESIERNFQACKVTKNCALVTIKDYCSAIRRTVEKFKLLADDAVSESSSTAEAIHKLIDRLNQDGEFIADNSMEHNLLSAALAAFEHFIVFDGKSDDDIKMGIGTNERTEEASVSDRLVCIFKDTFTGGIGISYVDFTILKNAYESKYGKTLDFSDEQIKCVIKKKSIQLRGNTTRYIHIDNLATADVLGEIEQYLDKEFEKGTERIYAEPLYLMFRDRMGIVVNRDLLMQVIETQYGNKYKTNKRSLFIQLAAHAPTTNISQEIEECIATCLSQEIVPFDVEGIAKKFPHYPKARIQKALEDSNRIIKTVDGYYAHVDYVYIDDNEITSVKNIIAEDVGSDGYKTLDTLYSAIDEAIPSIIENNEGIGKKNILKAIQYQVRDTYQVASKRLADQDWDTQVFEPLCKERK